MREPSPIILSDVLPFSFVQLLANYNPRKIPAHPISITDPATLDLNLLSLGFGNTGRRGAFHGATIISFYPPLHAEEEEDYLYYHTCKKERATFGNGRNKRVMLKQMTVWIVRHEAERMTTKGGGFISWISIPVA